MTYKDYSIAKDDNKAPQIVMRKIKYRRYKKRKREQRKPYIRRDKVYFGKRRPYF